MIQFYKSNIHGKVQKIPDWEVGCWVRCIAPTDEEQEMLLNDYHLDPEFIQSAIDEEESSHIDVEDENVLVVVDVPISVENDDDSLEYTTMPMGVILTPKNLITICTRECAILENFAKGRMKMVYTNFRVQFMLKILFAIASNYIMVLRQIDRLYSHVEQELEKSQKNSDLMRLLDLRKSLVYLSSSLKANERTIERIRMGRMVRLYEEDHDLLEDLLIEIKQAIDMSGNSLSVISSTTEAFNGILSNNLNNVMKILTSITLLISVPTLISGIYGMNVEHLPIPFFWFVIALCVVVVGLVFVILKKKDML